MFERGVKEAIFFKTLSFFEGLRFNLNSIYSSLLWPKLAYRYHTNGLETEHNRRKRAVTRVFQTETTSSRVCQS